jgi:hypothetical protein
MNNENNYLQLLFNNAAFLLNQDLKKYKLHPVEEKYFNDAIKFFRDLSENLESLETDREITTSNLMSFYAIPVVISALDINKAEFHESKKDNIELAKYIADILSEYLSSKTMDDNRKNILVRFFRYLGSQSSNHKKFEKCEYLDSYDGTRLTQVYA